MKLLSLFILGLLTVLIVGDVSAFAETTAPAVTQNTVTTTGPVASETIISVGTIGSQVLQWVMSVFGALLGTAGLALLMRMFTAAGLKISDAARVRLQEIVVNGLNAGAAQLEDQMRGRGQIAIKNAVVAKAVTYVQDHGVETLNQLGIDPKSNMAVDAIKARIETAIADPMVPTPAVLAPKVLPDAFPGATAKTGAAT